MSLKVLISDDDKHIRMILRKTLSKFPDVEIVGESQSGPDAVKLLEKLDCNCIFTDVEMPGGDGITAAKQILDIHPNIKIIFITAHQEYMPQAFEIYAYDYLIKPFSIKRLEQTVKKIQAQINSEAILQKNAVVDSGGLNSDKIAKIYLKAKDGSMPFEPNDIYMSERENNQTILVLKNERINVSETLTELEAILPNEIFIRSHKSYIININRIHKLVPYGRWTYVVKFNGINVDALITRKKAKELESKFHWIM